MLAVFLEKRTRAKAQYVVFITKCENRNAELIINETYASSLDSLDEVYLRFDFTSRFNVLGCLFLSLSLFSSTLYSVFIPK